MNKAIFAALCLILFSLGINAQDRTAEKEIRDFYQRYQTANSARNVAFIESALADDYSYTNPYGFAETRAEVIEFIKSEKTRPTFIVNSFKTDPISVRIYGDTAVVTNEWTMQSTSPLAHVGDVMHEDKGRYTGIFVRQNGGWRIVQEHDSERSHDRVAMEKQVGALGRAYTDMIRRNDASSIAKILADDYLLADETGKVYTKEQDLATYKDRAKAVKIDTVEYKDQKVRMITGSVAIDHATIRFVGSRNGKPFDVTERCTTTWHFRDGRWVIVADHFSYVK